MLTYTHIAMTGTLLAVPLSQYIQCGDIDSRGDAEPTALGDDEEEDAEPRYFPGWNQVTKLEDLGKHVFFDEISVPKNRMGCATCHDPNAGWTFPDSKTNLGQVVATGANQKTHGSFKTPTVGYASLIPPFFSGCAFGLPGLCGGVFWNGRAEGNVTPVFPDGAAQHVRDEVFEVKKANFKGYALKYLYADFLGPLADQALNPFPSPFEQNIPIQDVCKHVAKSEYAWLFKSAWGESIDCSSKLYGASKQLKTYEVNFRRLAVALAAFQASDEVNSFSSKRDVALRRELWGIDKDDTPGKFPLVGLSAKENLGHELFYNTLPNPFAPVGAPLDAEATVLNVPPNTDLPITNCSFCHRSSQDLIDGTDPEERYADDAYHNIGVPKNWEIPVNPLNPGAEVVLAAHTGRVGPAPDAPDDRGLIKTPTLRNVDKRPYKSFVKAYMHNGWFKSLESVVHFYNTANVDGDTAAAFGVTRCDVDVKTVEDALAHKCWPEPEFPNSAIETPLVGDLHLTAEQEAAIVSYLKAFTDTKTVKPPK